MSENPNGSSPPRANPYHQPAAVITDADIEAARLAKRRKTLRLVAVASVVFVLLGFMGQWGAIMRVGMVLAGLAGLGGVLISNTTGNWLERSNWMTGGDTPYEEQYSYQQAMVMRGQIAEALESYEQAMASGDATASVRLKAAELYAKEGKNPQRAAELFREVLRLPTVKSGDATYATNRLVDLLAGPLKDPGRAMVELRKFIDRYPDLPAAQNARAALRAMKEGASSEE
jgi:hypothetical protein